METAAFPGLLPLLFQPGIETAEGVALQPLHGTAAVQNGHQFRPFLFHRPPVLYVWFTNTVSGNFFAPVAWQATFVKLISPEFCFKKKTAPGINPLPSQDLFHWPALRQLIHQFVQAPDLMH